jgi:hypothetical protein
MNDGRKLAEGGGPATSPPEGRLLQDDGRVHGETQQAVSETSSRHKGFRAHRSDFYLPNERPKPWLKKLHPQEGQRICASTLDPHDSRLRSTASNTHFRSGSSVNHCGHRASSRCTRCGTDCSICLTADSQTNPWFLRTDEPKQKALRSCRGRSWRKCDRGIPPKEKRSREGDGLETHCLDLFSLGCLGRLH